MLRLAVVDHRYTGKRQPERVIDTDIRHSVDGHPSNLCVIEGRRHNFAVQEVYWLIERAEQ